jgi:hypothetical protein
MMALDKIDICFFLYIGAVCGFVIASIIGAYYVEFPLKNKVTQLGNSICKEEYSNVQYG